MDLHSQRKNRQSDHRLLAAAGHHVPGKRHLRDIELFIDRPEARLSGFSAARLQSNSFGSHFAVQQRSCAMIIGKHDAQLEVVRHDVSFVPVVANADVSTLIGVLESWEENGIRTQYPITPAL